MFVAMWHCQFHRLHSGREKKQQNKNEKRQKANRFNWSSMSICLNTEKTRGNNSVAVSKLPFVRNVFLQKMKCSRVFCVYFIFRSNFIHFSKYFWQIREQKNVKCPLLDYFNFVCVFVVSMLRMSLSMALPLGALPTHKMAKANSLIIKFERKREKHTHNSTFTCCNSCNSFHLSWCHLFYAVADCNWSQFWIESEVFAYFETINLSLHFRPISFVCFSMVIYFSLSFSLSVCTHFKSELSDNFDCQALNINNFFINEIHQPTNYFNFHDLNAIKYIRLSHWMVSMWSFLDEFPKKILLICFSDTVFHFRFKC